MLSGYHTALQKAFLVSGGQLLFIGIHEELLVYASRQNFAVIREYGFAAGIVEKTVACLVPAGRFRREFEPQIDILDDAHTKTGGYVGFHLTGRLYYCQSGLVFGILPIPTDWQRA